MPNPLVRADEDAGVVIAGGTSGVGPANALGSVDAGVPRVALLARDPARGESARAAVLDRCPDAEVVSMIVDAPDPAAVKEAIGVAHAAVRTIHVLVNSTTTACRPALLHRPPQADIAPILMGQALPPMLLTHAVLPMIQAQGGSRRVEALAEPITAWDGAWLAAVVTVRATHRTARRPLCAGLTWAGSGNPTPGLWLSPHVERVDEVRRLVVELDLTSQTVCVIGRLDETVGLDEADLVARGWDLAALAAHYGEVQCRRWLAVLRRRFAELDAQAAT